MALTGKTVLVTGGSSGIGRRVALAAADRGADIVNADMDRQLRSGGDPTDGLVADRGGDARSVETDVTDLDQVAAAGSAADLGGLDIVVKSAGWSESYATEDTSSENCGRSLAVNLTGVYHGFLAGVERMRARGDGGWAMA